MIIACTRGRKIETNQSGRNNLGNSPSSIPHDDTCSWRHRKLMGAIFCTTLKIAGPAGIGVIGACPYHWQQQVGPHLHRIRK